MTADEQTLTYDAGVEQTTTEDNLNADEQDSIAVGEQMQEAEAGLLAGKYENTQELEKAYNALERKLGEKSEPVSEESESENEPDEEESNDYEPNILDALWEEGTNDSLSEETFEELKNMDPVDVAKMAMEQRNRMQGAPQSRDFTHQDVDQIQGLVGGEENYNQMLGWAFLKHLY